MYIKYDARSIISAPAEATSAHMQWKARILFRDLARSERPLIQFFIGKQFIISAALIIAVDNVN